MVFFILAWEYIEVSPLNHPLTLKTISIKHVVKTFSNLYYLSSFYSKQKSYKRLLILYKHLYTLIVLQLLKILILLTFEILSETYIYLFTLD